MMGTTSASIAIALVFALGALPAAAEHRSHERGDRALELTQRLSAATHELYRSAAERTRHRSWSRWRALSALRDLDCQAQEVHQSAKSRGLHDRRTQRQVREFQVALHRAEARLSALHRVHGIHKDFARVGKLSQQLDSRIAKRTDDRHERDRDDRYAYNRGRYEPFSGVRWSFGYRY